MATTSPPSSACRSKALAFTRYRLCHWCLNHHALRCRTKHVFVPWTVFDIAGAPVSFSILSVAKVWSRTGAGGFVDRCSHEHHRRHGNMSTNRAKVQPREIRQSPPLRIFQKIVAIKFILLCWDQDDVPLSRCGKHLYLFTWERPARSTYLESMDGARACHEHVRQKRHGFLDNLNRMLFDNLNRMLYRISLDARTYPSTS